jgi:guanylate kinase
VRNGSIVVISAPSGAGKTSICSAVVNSDKNAVYSVSYTTRKPRGREKNGREYFFTGAQNFKKMIKAGSFAEWAKVHENYYGTPRSFLDKTLKSGKNVLLDIDVQGGLKIKKFYPDACMIFIMTRNLKILKERLSARNSDSKETIDIRMKNARKELSFFNKYDYFVINDDLGEAVKSVRTIIKSLGYKICKNKKYFQESKNGSAAK